MTPQPGFCDGVHEIMPVFSNAADAVGSLEAEPQFGGGGGG
jgi:hypothetical protein